MKLFLSKKSLKIGIFLSILSFCLNGLEPEFKSYAGETAEYKPMHMPATSEQRSFEKRMAQAAKRRMQLEKQLIKAQQEASSFYEQAFGAGAVDLDNATAHSLENAFQDKVEEMRTLFNQLQAARKSEKQLRDLR